MHLGSSRKMDDQAALQKARGMKAEALGLKEMIKRIFSPGQSTFLSLAEITTHLALNENAPP